MLAKSITKSARFLLLIAPAALLACISLAAQIKYFPPNTFSREKNQNDFTATWYSRQLAALQEPSLLGEETQSTQSYRFLWLRTFNHPIAVRLDIRDDGTGTLTTKIASGAGGYAPGSLTTNKTTPLERAQVKSFLDLLTQTDFWNQPTWPNQQSGTDGSEWIIEGSKSGQYHVIDRWTPTKGPAYELGTKLAIELAGLNVPKKEFY